MLDRHGSAIAIVTALVSLPLSYTLVAALDPDHEWPAWAILVLLAPYVVMLALTRTGVPH